MPKNISHKVASFDRNPAGPTLLYKGISEKKNIIGGILGLAFIALTLYLIITKGWNVWNKEDVNLISFINRDMSKVSVGKYQIILAVQIMDQDAKFTTIPFKDYPKYGIWPHLLQISFNMSNSNASSFFSMDPQWYAHAFDAAKKQQKLNGTKLTLESMVPCPFMEDDQFLCADKIEFDPQCSLTAMDFKSCKSGKQYFVFIGKCDSRVVPDCNTTLTPNLYPVLFVSDTKFNVLKKNTREVFQQSAMAINNPPDSYPLYSTFRLVIDVPITKLVIQSDQSLLPQTIPFFSQVNRTQTYFYPKQQIGLVSTNGFWPVYMSFHIVRSPFTQNYYRSFPRFDTMLGQVFGLVGLISIIVTCCCSGYNQWLMKKHIQNNLQTKNRQGQYGQRPKKTKNFLQYWKQNIVNVCKRNRKQERCIDMIKLSIAVQKLIQNAGPQFQYKLNKIFEEMDDKSEVEPEQEHQEQREQIKSSTSDKMDESIKQNDETQRQLKKSLLQSSTSKNQQ